MYFLTEIELIDFEVSETLSPKRFKLVSRCANEKDRSTAEILQVLKKLDSNDRRQAVKGLLHFLKLAQLGSPFNQLADKKVVHEAFKSFYCETTKRNETVWRYRHGDIRILFYYGVDKIVLLANALPKRSNKLSVKDENQARQTVNDFLVASQNDSGIVWI